MTIMLSELHKALRAAGASEELAMKASVEVFDEMRRRRAALNIDKTLALATIVSLGTGAMIFGLGMIVGAMLFK